MKLEVFIYQWNKNVSNQSKKSEIKPDPSCLKNSLQLEIWKKKSYLNGYEYNFSVDYNITDNSNIINIHI